MRVKKKKQTKAEGSDIPAVPSEGAVATGRREPYHLIYIRRHGQITPKNACDFAVIEGIHQRKLREET